MPFAARIGFNYINDIVIISPPPPPPPIWLPTDLSSGLALWLDASDTNTITMTNNAVSQWDDKSGNSRHVSQSNVSVRPTYNATGLNNLPTISSTDSPSKFLVTNGNTSGFSGGANLWAFVTATMDSNTNSFGRLISYDQTTRVDWNQSDLAALILRAVSGNGIGSYRNSANRSFVTASLATPMVFGTVYDGTNNISYLNGTAGNSSASTGNFSSSPRITILTYGASPTSNSWRGNCSEIIIGDTALSSNDRQKIEGYLAHKWGLTANLPANHPYKSSPP
jgi:hypothetical protein